jgi:Domain of unknown function (DUF4259)
MGTWGHHAFDNDDAGDFGSALAKGGVTSIEATFDLVLGSEGYLEASDCWNAIAAAESLCVILGRRGSSIPAEVTAWASHQAQPSRPLIEKAKLSLARIRRDSELKELWDESPEAAAWDASMADLTRRLGP